MEEWEGDISTGWVVVRYRVKAKPKPNYAVAHIEAVPNLRQQIADQHGEPVTFAIIASELARPVVLKTMGHAMLLIQYLAGKDDVAPVLH